MEDRIKSAWEKALERAQQMPEVPEEELRRAEYLPRGRMVAARYLKEKDYDLAAGVAAQDSALRPYLAEGARDTLLLNIALPRDDDPGEQNRRAMNGLVALSGNRAALAQALGELEYLFDYYGKARSSTYQRLKDSFGKRLARARQKVEARMGPGVVADVERQPAFQEEWSRLQAQLAAQFEDKLGEIKEAIRAIG